PRPRAHRMPGRELVAGSPLHGGAASRRWDADGPHRRRRWPRLRADHRCAQRSGGRHPRDDPVRAPVLDATSGGPCRVVRGCTVDRGSVEDATQGPRHHGAAHRGRTGAVAGGSGVAVMPTPLPPAFQVLLPSRTAYRRVVRVRASRGSVSADVSRFVRGGGVTCDGRRAMRWDGRLTLQLPEGSPLVPIRDGDLLTNSGTVVTIELGAKRADDTEATVPAGVFMVST